MKILSLVLIILLMSCGAGYDRVRYAQMPEPPRVTLRNDELMVITSNKDGEGLSVYKVDINIRDRSRTIELRGYQAVGKAEKTEFTVTLQEAQLTRISDYRIYWIDPGGKKTRVQVKDLASDK